VPTSFARFATSWTRTLQSSRSDGRRKRTSLRFGRYAQVRSGAIQGRSLKKHGRHRTGERGCPPISFESDGRQKTFRLFFVSCRATPDVQSDIVRLIFLYFLTQSDHTPAPFRCVHSSLREYCQLLSFLVVAGTCSYSFTVFPLCILSVWRTTFLCVLLD